MPDDDQARGGTPEMVGDLQSAASQPEVVSTHTPGPWEWDGRYTVGIPHARGYAAFRTNPEDARLIAAPDLLTVAKAASHALKSYVYGNSAPTLAHDVAVALDAAIEKAQGRE